MPEVEIQAGEGTVPMTLDEIQKCNLDEMARDKLKSRALQRSLARGGKEFADLLFVKAQPHIADLMKDQHGNYLMQKILEVINIEQFDTVFGLLKDDLIETAKDQHGTRAVQKIVEQAVARDRIEQLMQALPATALEDLARHITGFHVIVKLLDALPASRKEASDLLEQLCGQDEKVASMAKDQWGCCVLKKCVDRADGEMKEKIVVSIALNAMDLVQDPFGNYVVQHLVINRQQPQVPSIYVGQIIDAFKGHIFELSLQKYSSNVLEKCLGNSSDKDRNKVINEILNPPNGLRPSEAVRRLVVHQFGNYVFQQALEVAKDPQFSLLVEHSKQHIQELYMEASKNYGAGRQERALDAPENVGGNLPADHLQRLAVKLVKKYPGLTEGLDMGNMMVGMEAAWQFDYDPMGYGMGYYGYDAYGYPMALDPYGLGLATFPMATGKGQARGKGNQGGKKKGKSGESGSKNKQAQGAKGGETVKVGRIVGFWPNYEITYDEVPAHPAAVSGGNRGGNKGKKAKPKERAPKPSTAAA
jgi:hypothetical protein